MGTIRVIKARASSSAAEGEGDKMQKKIWMKGRMRIADRSKSMDGKLEKAEWRSGGFMSTSFMD
eukprot:6199954-Pleurochrysis_carterae.AAC.2